MDETAYKKIIEELIELVDEGVYIVDRDGVGLFYNEAMAKNEKINVTDVVGKEFHKAFPGVRLSESTMYHALKKRVATKNKQQTYTNLYGKEVTTINSTVPVNVEGRTVAAIEVARDITNIRSMSDTILELQGDKLGTTKATKTPTIKKYTFEDIIGQNRTFAAIVERAKRAAKNNASVFIYGETGTGKELFAQSIHYASSRRENPFLAQNCAALPESLLEGILFGTTKGGFTGAVDRAGLFEQANGGTLLLDEISAMPYELQSKLLRVLQEDYIRRVGGTTDIPVDVRIIATVNEPPEVLMAEGKLRKDLYYRLNVVSISIPPLRNRKDDIPVLTDAFLDKHNKRFDKEVWMVSEAAMARLCKYDYPGNIRELENIIVQSVSMAETEHVLTDRLLQMPMQVQALGKDIEQWDRQGPLNEYMSNLEKEIIRGVMISEGGNVSKSAEILQIKRQTLQHKLKKYGIKE
ncbi:sigma-54 interaction domain-containing protein [Aminicella lysinilytica]|uniref:Arginine utilization regulatory protein n=2 Tax=Aminicella lysinilytica TaxID=433323 RepID=A0A4R6Q8Q0_9FIRM|nr:sigma 54-interacting transcriptional regulator [Aminicella lysinilytica]TDP58938.1 arginine utilization regulatory protein [Aminicella lysinilytica]